MNSLTACSLTGETAQNSDLNQPSNTVLPAEIAESNFRTQVNSIRQTGTKLTPWGVALDEKRGFVWVAEPGCDFAPVCQDPATGGTAVFPGIIGKFSMADGSLIMEYQQPKGYSSPMFPQVSKDGQIWFTEPSADAIGVFDPDTQNWSQYPVTKGSAPYDLVIDNNGNIWFTEFLGGQIGFLNGKTRQIVETPIPTLGSRPYEITKDHKGNIWFAENGQGLSRIGTFKSTTSGTISIQDYATEANLLTQPHGIVADAKDRIWFTEGFKGTLAVFDPATGSVNRYQVGRATACRRPPYNCTHISGVGVDKNGNVWFDDSLNAVVGYFSPSTNAIYVQMLPDPNSHPHDGLAVQSNGTVWFTEQFGSITNGGPKLDMYPPGTVK